jgi:[lysine-biosynthesis-protein LysW]--L-2-aminoadipate ligase
MKIGMIVDLIRLDEKLILNEAKKLNAKIELINSSDLVLNITDLNNHVFKDIDIFLQRCMSTLRGLYITKILEEYGFNVINQFKTASNCIDKVLCSLLLAKNQIPTPETMVTFTEDAGLKALELLGYPAIIKPTMGSWARLVAKVNDEDAAKSIFEDRKEMGSWYKILYIQKFVQKPKRDIRSAVVGNETVAAIYRVNDSDWRTNTARGGRAVKCELSPRLEELSLKAAEAIGGGVLGIDLMENNGDFVVHEINHSPEFKNVQRVTGVNIANKIVNYLVEQARR